MAGLLYATPQWLDSVEWGEPEAEDIVVSVPDEHTPEEVLTEMARERDNYETAAMAIECKLKDLQERKARMKRGADHLKKQMLQFCIARGLQKIKTPEYTFSVVKGRTVLEVVDEDKVDYAWRKQDFVPPIEKTRLNAHFKETGEIPEGCRAITTPQSLTIRSC